jgi:hypothetical protein
LTRVPRAVLRAGARLFCAGACLTAPGAFSAAAAEERMLQAPGGREVRYVVLDKSTRLPSAFPTASLILTHLANGKLEEAAKLSNAPGRRREVFQDYRAQVGDEEFRRIYARYLDPRNRVTAEIAIGPHRLLVWTLGEAGDSIVGQYYVHVDGRFVMDDVPSEARQDLRHVLESYRKLRPSARKG